MSEETEDQHGLARGLHHLAHAEHEGKKKDRKIAIIGVVIAGVGLLALFLVRGNGGGSSGGGASSVTPVQPSQPFVPNPTDVSYGTTSADQASMYLPLLVSIIALEKKAHTTKVHHKKGYGHSPTGHSHGHRISPKTGSHPGTHQKGHSTSNAG